VTTVSPPPPANTSGRLSAGDSFEVRVFQEPDLSSRYRVSPDGTIDFPLCGRMTVVDLTTSDLSSRLTNCLKVFIKQPQVSVLSVDIGSQRRVVVFGYVQKPGEFPYEDRMSIIQAISLAGGFAQYAAQNAVSVKRTAGETDQQFKVAVQDIGTGKAPNFFLMPGDIVYVPESVF
jgi:protein involved in polysaccharide export with SLBB domain